MSGATAGTSVAIIDCDFHNSVSAALAPYLSERWRTYIDLVGQRQRLTPEWMISPQRNGAWRLDTRPAEGRPGSDPAFARAQLLEEHGVAAAIINNIECVACGGAPVALEVELARATNDCNREHWLAESPQWWAAINVAADHPVEAAAEIARCREQSDRYVQVLIGSRCERPQGNPKYWPIYEAAEHYGLPVAFHVGTSRYHHMTGVGPETFYYEHHLAFALAAQAIVPSFIFEGVFDRFPDLRIVLVESGWEWVVPYCWRLDASWRVLRDEVPHLRRKPSEYLRDHFWFTTQPSVEPPRPREHTGLFEQWEQAGFGGRLMFSSDYPHWDMDAPLEAIPRWLPAEVRRRILSENARELYGMPL